MIGKDGPNWCIKWNGHLRTVASYDIGKTREQRVIAEKDQEEDKDQVPDPKHKSKKHQSQVNKKDTLQQSKVLIQNRRHRQA